MVAARSPDDVDPFVWADDAYSRLLQATHWTESILSDCCVAKRQAGRGRVGVACEERKKHCSLTRGVQIRLETAMVRAFKKRDVFRCLGMYRTMLIG